MDMKELYEDVTLDNKTIAQQSLRQVRDYLRASLFERDNVIDAVLAAVIAKHHVFMLGVPGTGKSHLVRLLANCFSASSYFYILMSKTTKPAEVWGQQSIQAMREDRLHFDTDGYFPSADFAFCDELFKGSSQINNKFLDGMNERVFKNGKVIEKIPLRTLFAASNETPADSSQDALYDRFAVRLLIHPVRNDENLLRLMTGNVPKLVAPQLSLATLDEAYEESQKVRLSSEFTGAMLALVASVRYTPMYQQLKVSDRLLGWISNVVKAHVYLQGRNTVELDDIAFVRHCIWKEEADVEAAAELVNSLCSEERQIVAMQINELRSVLDELKDARTSAAANALLLRCERAEDAIRGIRNQSLKIVRDGAAICMAASNKCREKFASITGTQYKPVAVPDFDDEFDTGLSLAG